MKKLINFILILVTFIFISNPLLSTEKKNNYSIEQTTEILQSRKLGNIKLDHDDHVYKCMKLSKEAENLEGAINVLIASKTDLGYTLDDEEVKLIIKISNLDTNLYQDIIISSKKIGKKKTTVAEHQLIVDEIKEENGKYLLSGIERAGQCHYKIENDYFTRKRLNLLVELGKIKDEDKLLNIYAAMRRIGMESNVNSKGVEVLYKLCNLEGDVAYKINEYLKINKWKSRKQPGEREYVVIKDLMKANYVAIEKQRSDYDKIKIYKDKPKKKNKNIATKSKRKYYAKKTSNKSKDKKKGHGSLSPCTAYISQN